MSSGTSLLYWQRRKGGAVGQNFSFPESAIGPMRSTTIQNHLLRRRGAAGLSVSSPRTTGLWPTLLVTLALGVSSLPSDARATCPPRTPVACPECGAVALIPHTQRYTLLSHQPQGAAHADLTTRYICNNPTNWTEPSTGKTMPVLMGIHGVGA